MSNTPSHRIPLASSTGCRDYFLRTLPLLDKVSLPERAASTHLRNHYLHIERDRLPEFYKRLEKMARGLAEEFAADAGASTEFLNVLIVGTPV